MNTIHLALRIKALKLVAAELAQELSAIEDTLEDKAYIEGLENYNLKH